MGDSALDIIYRCQFRTFQVVDDGEVLNPPDEGICFTEDEVFVGGIVWFEFTASPDFPGCSEGDENCDVPYDGWSARESVGLMETTLTLLDSDQQPIVIVTPVKGGHHRSGASVVWKQTAAIFQNLAPGSYELLTEYDHPAEAIFGDFEPDLMPFTVLAHDVAQEQGRPEGGFPGSVTCPSPE